MSEKKRYKILDYTENERKNSTAKDSTIYIFYLKEIKIVFQKYLGKISNFNQNFSKNIDSDTLPDTHCRKFLLALYK